MIDLDFPIWSRSGTFRFGPVTSSMMLTGGLDRYLFQLFLQQLVLDFSSSYCTLIMPPSHEGHEKPSTSILKERRFKLSRSVTCSLFMSNFADAPPGPVIVAGERLRAHLVLHHTDHSVQAKENQMRRRTSLPGLLDCELTVHFRRTGETYTSPQIKVRTHGRHSWWHLSQHTPDAPLPSRTGCTSWRPSFKLSLQLYSRRGVLTLPSISQQTPPFRVH